MIGCRSTHLLKRSAQALLGCTAICLGRLAEIPWLAEVCLAVPLAVALAAGHAPIAGKARVWRWASVVASASTLGLFGSLLASASNTNWWERYYAVLFWLMAASLGLACSEISDPRCNGRWRRLVFLWAFSGDFIWLSAAYLADKPTAFVIGLLLGVGLLLGARMAFSMSQTGILLTHSTILLFVALPITNLIVRPPKQMPQPSVSGVRYSRETARKAPDRFARWWSEYLGQLRKLARSIYIPDPDGVLPFRLKPGSHGQFFQSRISINSLGLRGREIGEKGSAFRIVVLGESTTFGFTVKPDGRPWPELLEEIVRERIGWERPVEVINAGVPSYDLQQNVQRLTKDILPLDPDLIVSYHGYNGFKLLAESYSRSPGSPPPSYKPRPVRLLAGIEYRLKMLQYRWREHAKALSVSSVFANPMQTDYAKAYRQLIGIARTHRIPLALATFSMAVNRRSDPGTVEFYRPGFPLVQWEIGANTIHTLIVKTLAREHPEVCMVDTRPHLDGVDRRFIDLVHLTQEGRQQLAENMFAGLRSLLETHLHPARQAR